MSLYSPTVDEYKIKCLQCGFTTSGKASFCPSCGAPLPKPKSDQEISFLLKTPSNYPSILDMAYNACIADIENGDLHKNLFLYHKEDLLSKEIEYQDKEIKRFIERNQSNPNLKEALSHYKLGLIYESNLMYENNLKNLLHKNNHIDPAMTEFSTALSLIPDFASAHLRRGMLYDALSGISHDSVHLQNAINHYLWAEYHSNQWPLAYYSCGLALERKNPNESLTHYLKCVALDPDCAAAHNNLGLIYADKKEFELAQKEFTEVLRIFPNHPVGLRNLERARKKKGRDTRQYLLIGV